MKVRIKDFNGKVDEKELKVRNELHFEIQQRNKSKVFKPKKGKGSFRRNSKYKKLEENIYDARN